MKSIEKDYKSVLFSRFDVIGFYHGFGQPVWRDTGSRIVGGYRSILQVLQRRVSLGTSGWTELHTLRFGHQGNIQTIQMLHFRQETNHL